MTIANQIADLFDNNGRKFESVCGQDLNDVCRDRAGSIDRNFDKMRYGFDDGSAIVVLYGAWDVAPVDCKGFCWEGPGCSCRDGAE